jgi:transcriptional regulator with XRE-family HTH domain
LTAYSFTYMSTAVSPLVLRLRQARERAGLSQAELARRSGVPQPTISRLEAGATAVRLEHLARLAAALSIKRPGDLLRLVRESGRRR